MARCLCVYRSSSLESWTWLRTHGMKYLSSWSPGVVEGYGVMMCRWTRSFSNSSQEISSSLLMTVLSTEAVTIPLWKSRCFFCGECLAREGSDDEVGDFVEETLRFFHNNVSQTIHIEILDVSDSEVEELQEMRHLVTHNANIWLL